jgi:hypothetical protein
LPQTRIISEIDKAATLGKRIDNAQPPPLNLAGQDIAGCNQRQLAIRLDIEGVEVTDKCLVSAVCNTDTHLAPPPLPDSETAPQAAE